VDGKCIENPTLDMIAEAFRSIPIKESKWFTDNSSLIILGRNSTNSLSTCGQPSEGWGWFTLEKDGRAQDWAKFEMLDEATVIRIFQQYATGDDSWQNDFEWEFTDDTSANIQRRLWKIVALAALVVLTFWIGVKWWYRLK
jgi:hypothetical protein